MGLSSAVINCSAGFLSSVFPSPLPETETLREELYSGSYKVGIQAPGAIRSGEKLKRILSANVVVPHENWMREGK